MKIVIFGAGRYYQKRKDKISSNMEIVAFIDNNIQLHKKKIDGTMVFSPCKIEQISYDKIVLMSAKRSQMQEQLIKLGVPEENIWSWEELNSEMWHGTFRFYAGNSKILGKREKVLIISTDLNYNGGTLAVVYAVLALQDRGFDVVLAAPDGNSRFIEEMLNSGINIVICPGMPYLRKEEIFLIKQFDIVIVNVFQMISCACEISKIRPTMWWIHEPSELYKSIVEQFPEYMSDNRLKRLNIYAVSIIAQRNFNYYFPNRIHKILFYGIPDQNKKENIPVMKKEYLVFAIIGTVCSIKAQDIFIRAVQLLKNEYKKNMQCWIIGSIGNDEYGNKVRELVSEDTSFKLWGELTRNEMQGIYKEIDVVVCSSIEDCLPITVTEGMMFQKVCIVSNNTGSANFIEDGKNGFLVPAGDVVAWKEKVEWVIANKEKCESIGRKARETYEEYFSMDIFGCNMECTIKETIEYWN